MRTLSVIAVSLMLTACGEVQIDTTNLPQANDTTSEHLQNQESQTFSTQLYSVVFPKLFSRWTTISSGMSGPAYPYFTGLDSALSEVSATIYPRDSRCPALGIQVPLTLDVGGGTAEWGRVDFWDTWGSEGGVPMDQLPACEPLQVKDHLSLPLDTTTNVVYAFCSEKDEKAVIICIQQATNNPALAEEIFRSFRWLE